MASSRSPQWAPLTSAIRDALSTSVTRATILHLMSWCPIWLLSLIDCWFNHTLQNCYIQIHNRNFCAYFWPSPVSWPPKRLFISSDPPFVVFVSVYHAHSEACRPPSLLSVRLPFSQWYFSCGVQLTTLYCYADGFFRNNFYIYLKILNYGILFLLSLLSVICQYSVTSSAHFLPWIKLGLSGHLKR